MLILERHLQFLRLSTGWNEMINFLTRRILKDNELQLFGGLIIDKNIISIQGLPFLCIYRGLIKNSFWGFRYVAYL